MDAITLLNTISHITIYTEQSIGLSKICYYGYYGTFIYELLGQQMKAVIHNKYSIRTTTLVTLVTLVIPGSSGALGPGLLAVQDEDSLFRLIKI